MRLIISAVTWDQYLRSGMCQLELVPVADKYGCAGIEFRPYWRSSMEELYEIQDFLAEYNLECTYAANDCLLAATEEGTRQSLLRVEKSLAKAERLGAKVLRVLVAVGPVAGAQLEAAWWRREIGLLIDAAAAKGIIIAVENAPNPTTGDAGLLRDLVAPFASPWFKVTFDTGNWLPAGWDPLQAADILAGHIGYVHLKDMIKRPDGFVPAYPGEGDMDLAAVIDKIEQTGYRGLYALEFPGGRSPASKVKASLKHLRKINIEFTK
ncbi:sugar phosphate isomerase/epimerase family protein [Anaeroselena agilis]|uniref:Sugar phosphate isomerase/epimerase family protein n=1 Tax=Anaeroselena agilis TaxID=3063788 RepID=A0ABU3P5T7_9FIRM|nr:sugar phosphate isomerase/epimerase family protein [Selenomonadales bacterium 4137-cl]